MKTKKTDKRPDPKPRLHPQLWQAYLFWHELVEMRKRHTLRISSIDRGKSNLDAQIEHDFLSDMQVDIMIEKEKKVMLAFGEEVGCIWEWVTSIRGLREGSLAAQLIAQIDDISKFSTISKLWRFAGYGVDDGRMDRRPSTTEWQKGKRAFNGLLAAVCYLIGDEFVKQQTPIYSDIYYEEKSKLRQLHPNPVPARKGSPWPEDFTDSHVHRMAMRKAVKIFLSHLWVKWRECEGLPVSQPYVQAILGHTNIIEPRS